MFISLDLETTGFSSEKDQIIEFGAIKFDLEGHRETLQFLINPEIKIPKIVTHITNITDDQVKDAALFADKKQEIIDFIGDLPIVGHNIQFDTNFLRSKGIPLTNDEYDTCQLSSILLPGLPSYSLEIISDQLEIEHVDAHRALDDAIAAMELFLKLVKQYQALPQDMLDQFKELSKRTNWPLKNLLTNLKHNPIEKVKQKEKKEITPNEEHNELFDNKKSFLYQAPTPHEQLIHNFANNGHKDSYLTLPTRLFREVEQNLSDTISKLDSPRKYISLNRLETFTKQEHFEDYEFTALLKYIIWSKQTKTGLLEEIKLFHHEVKTLPKVNIDPNILAAEQEHFFKKALEKDKDSPAICTHNFIIDTKPDVKDLIILNIEEFIKSLFFQDSYFLRLDILLSQLETLKTLHPQNPTIENLISKSTIIFGYIGMMHEKYNDRNHYSPRTLITNIELSTNEWQKIVEGVKGLISTSKELSEINDEKTKTYLQNWKKSLESLSEIFLTPRLEKNQVWFTENMDKDVIIRKSPQTLNESLQTILKNCQNYKIVDENIDLNDNGTFLKNLLELSPHLPLKKVSEQRPKTQIFITKDSPEKDHDKEPILNFLNGYLKGSTAIVFNSKMQLQHYTLALTKAHPNLTFASQLTGSLGKITEQFKHDPENSVLLLTSRMWRNFKRQDLIKELIIHRLPFDPPSDPFISTLSQKFSNPFMELQIPKAVFSLKSIINKLKKDQENRVIILDPRPITKRYGQSFIDQIENISRPEIATLASL